MGLSVRDLLLVLAVFGAWTWTAMCADTKLAVADQV